MTGRACVVGSGPNGLAAAIVLAVVAVSTVKGTARFSQRSTTVALSFESCGTSNVIHSVMAAFSGFAVTRRASFD